MGMRNENDRTETPLLAAISGNTYPVRTQLRAMGGRWDADRRAWMVPAERAEEARRLVGAAPRTSASRTGSGRCPDCGGAVRRGYRYCYSCAVERREGGSRYAGGMSYTTRDGRFVLGEDD